MVCVTMNFKQPITKALKGQNHQHRATPCNWVIETFQALKGRDFASFLITPFQVGCKKCGYDGKKCSFPFSR